MNKFAQIGVLGGSLLASSVVSSATTIEIKYPLNEGGAVNERLAVVRKSIQRGDRVQIMAPCISACTLWLMVPPNRICYRGEGLAFFFHAAHDMVSGRTLPDATRKLLKRYPPRVQQAVRRKGGLKEDFIRIPVEDLIRRCAP